MDEKRWFAVYTRPRWEKKVAELLDKKEIINYCPLNRVHKQWRDRKKVIHEPLFKSYVFVRVSAKEVTTVLETFGIVRFVTWLKKPAVIRDEEIQTIREFLCEHSNVQIEPIPFALNDSVRIIDGPLSNREGHIIGFNQSRVKVYLPSLGFIMSVEIDKAHVQLVKTFNLPTHSGNISTT